MQLMRMRAETYQSLSISILHALSAIPAAFKNTLKQHNLGMEVGKLFFYHKCEDNCLTLYHSLAMKVKIRHLQSGVEVHLNKVFISFRVFF